MKKIIHHIALSEIGGVQQSFPPFYLKVRKEKNYDHCIYSTVEIDSQYPSLENFYNISKSIFNKIKFLYYLQSNNCILHSYNVIGGVSMFNLLNRFPFNKVLFHERGNAWNVSEKERIRYIVNANKADLILANSVATQQYLVQRFGLDENKVKVLLNGFLPGNFEIDKPKRSNGRRKVGFIARLDVPKGCHLFIEAARLLEYRTDLVFEVAGDGVLFDLLKAQASDLANISFLGRVDEPLVFISSIDLLIVPSIREPLGNVLIEAGFCKTPVIASNVDGIPEVITNAHSGILLNPKNKLTIKNVPLGAVPIPEYTYDSNVNMITRDIKEIDVRELADSISNLIDDEEKIKKFVKNLHTHVIKNFSLESYTEKINNVYSDIFND